MKVLRELLREDKQDTDKITVELPKPRNKQLNDVLRTRKGGRMQDKRKDYDRNKEKQKARKGDDE